MTRFIPSLEPERDFLGILAATAWVTARAEQVHIDPGAVDQVAATVLATRPPGLEWDGRRHQPGELPEDRLRYLLVLDALNFCFWGEPRWQVEDHGRLVNGYWALVAALRRADAAGVPFRDPAWLAQVTEADAASLLAGAGAIPLLPARAAHLREVGEGLGRRWEGSALALVEAAVGSAPRLVLLVAESFPSFQDVAEYAGRAVPLFKRAQIFVSDLAGCFQEQGPGSFRDLALLTAFADYKVPQVLRALGILQYGRALAEAVGARREIPSGHPWEVEIRAATIQSVEALRQAAARQGAAWRPQHIDWALWDHGQRLPAETEPYHRTRTVYY